MADNDFSSLSLEEKISHKVWKARLQAYEELTKLYKTTDQEAEFDKYSEHFKKIVTDSNVAAQEAGLTAVLAYVENAPNPSKTRDTVVPGIVEKCLGSTRAGTKTKAVELLLLYIEVDVPDPVVESVIAGLDSKVPKMVAATVFALKEIIRSYGAKVVSVKPILKTLAKLFGHADKNVRAESTQLVIELYKWLGPALNPALQDLKPVQIKELNEAFEKLPAEKPVAERLLRSQQGIETTTNESTAEDNNQDDDGSQPIEDSEIDPYDLADPVDALKKLSPSFYTELASTKWKERKEALEGLLSIVKTIKLADDNYSEMMAALAKRIGDANVMVGTIAANCIEAIALGLRKSCGQYKSVLIPPILEKLKEKKQTVVDALRAALDAIFASIDISELVEEVTAASGHKNPQVKAETHRWLTRCLKTIKSAPGKGEIKWISELFLKGLDDGDTNVREGAAEGLGTLMKAVGEKTLAPFIEKLDKIKEAKVREYFEKAEVKVVHTVPKKPAAAPKKAAPLPRKPAPAAPSNDTNKAMNDNGFDENMILNSPAAPKAKPPARLAARMTKKPASGEDQPPAASAPAAKVAPKAAPPKPAAKGGAVKVAAAKLKPDEPIRFKFSNDDFEARVPEVIPEAILKELLSSNWKSRLAAMESLHTHLETNAEDTESELVVRQLVKKPGFKEVNFQVSTKIYGVFQLLCEKAPSFTKGCAVLTVAGMAEKLGDMKLKKPVGECFSAYGEKYSLQFVLHHGYESWKKAKSPKVLADSLLWIRETLLEFGIVGLDVRELIEFLKTALGSSNAAVRNNSVSVLGCLRMYVGPDIRSFVQELSATQLTTIDAEFAKTADQTPPEPTKGLALLETITAAPSGKGGAGKSADVLDDLFPRVDISSQINSKLLKQLEDGNWKVRKEGLEEIQKILEATNKRIKPNVGDLPGALKGRLGDSNKNLVIMTLEILSTMSVAMGQPFEKPCRIVLPSVLGCLSDNKAHIRTAAISALDSFHETCTLAPMVPAIGTALAPDSPVLRKDLLKWCSDKLTALESEGVELPDLSSLVRPTFLCLQDRSADVRKNAQTVLGFLVKNVGYTAVRDQCSTALKGSSLQTVLAFVDGLKPAGGAPSKPSAGPNKVSPTEKKMELRRPPSVASNSSETKRSVSGSSDAKKPSGPSIVDKKRASVLPPPSPNKKSDEPFNSGLNLKPRAILNKRKSMMPPPTQIKAPSPSLDAEPPILTSDPRAKNVRADKDRNQNKWVFDAVRQDLVDLVADQMRPHFNPDVHKLLFSMEHNRDRDMLSGLTILDECIANRHYAQDRFGIDFDDLKERYVANSDTLLKYLTLRFYDTNTSLSLKTLELLEHLISLLDEDGYHLSEYEASAFLPQLINKLGEPKEVLRNQLRSILKQVYHLYSPNKVVVYVLEHGLKSKNARTRAECLDELSNLIKVHGINVIPIKSFPVIASHIGDRDAQVRNNALSAIVQAYLQIGDTIYKYTGKLSDKEKTMLDEKLKRSKPATASAPALPKPQERPATPQSKLTLPRAGTSLGHFDSHFDKSPGRLQRPMSTLPKPSSALPRPSSSLAKPSMFPRPSSALSNSSSLSISPSSSPKPHRPMSFLPRPGGLCKEEMTPERGTPDLPLTPAFHEYQSPQAVSRAPIFDSTFTPTASQIGPIQPKVDKHRVDMFASKITTADASEIVLLMKSIGDILNDDYTALLPNLNNIVSAMTLKIHILFEEPELESQPWCRQIKHMLLVFTKMFMKKDVAYNLRVDVLENTIEEILKLLLLEDLQKVEQTSNSPSMDKTLNTLLTKTIDHTDQNVLYQALFNLYERTLADFLSRPKDFDITATESDEYKLFDVVQKCIWKSSRSLKIHIEQRTIDLDRLFVMIHEFLTRVNPTEWRKKAHAKGLNTQDNPMKTAKAVLFHAAGTLQADVLQHVSLIPSPESSLVVVYLRSYLDKTIMKNSPSISGSPVIDTNGSSSSPSISTTPSSGPLGSRSNTENPSEDESHSRTSESHNTNENDEWDENGVREANLAQEMSPTDQMNLKLDRIFELIYDRKHTKQGVSELHDYLQIHPEAQDEFEKRLAKASKYFQSFIRRSLSNLSGDFQSPDLRSPMSSHTQSQSPAPRSSSRISYRESVASFEELLGQQAKAEPDSSQHVRIQEIQRMFGFRRGSLESHSDTDSPAADEKLTSSPRTQLANPFVGDI
ncbi:hypothetical protein K7432_004569 [Basidiobolus ranarum]|uniref:TOG domain-containing protein n=1 Tax=Basidiobolus ranarum TaxID=34480 RepID=A0ABR2W4Z6_9FUNG